MPFIELTEISLDGSSGPCLINVAHLTLAWAEGQHTSLWIAQASRLNCDPEARPVSIVQVRESYEEIVKLIGRAGVCIVRAPAHED